MISDGLDFTEKKDTRLYWMKIGFKQYITQTKKSPSFKLIN